MLYSFSHNATPARTKVMGEHHNGVYDVKHQPGDQHVSAQNIYSGGECILWRFFFLMLCYWIH